MERCVLLTLFFFFFPWRLFGGFRRPKRGGRMDRQQQQRQQQQQQRRRRGSDDADPRTEPPRAEPRPSRNGWYLGLDGNRGVIAVQSLEAMGRFERRCDGVVAMF